MSTFIEKHYIQTLAILPKEVETLEMSKLIGQVVSIRYVKFWGALSIRAGYTSPELTGQIEANALEGILHYLELHTWD